MYFITCSYLFLNWHIFNVDSKSIIGFWRSHVFFELQKVEMAEKIFHYFMLCIFVLSFLLTAVNHFLNYFSYVYFLNKFIS